MADESEIVHVPSRIVEMARCTVCGRVEVLDENVWTLEEGGSDFALDTNFIWSRGICPDCGGDEIEMSVSTA